MRNKILIYSIKKKVEFLQKFEEKSKKSDFFFAGVLGGGEPTRRGGRAQRSATEGEASPSQRVDYCAVDYFALRARNDEDAP